MTESRRSGTRLLALIALMIAILALAWIAYAPGLHGGFLFDDFANLPTLGATGPVDNWAAFWRYLTSGIADPTGRPVALLSFLVDAHDWPADPYSFKRTNLLLHLINASLLMLLLRRLGRCKANATPLASRASRLEWRVDMAAVLGAGFWLLHPLFVSTTLYVIQREAMLSAFFTLLGLTLWLWGRSDILQGRTLRGLLSITLGFGVCTLLAVLSKANGALLPALALVIECVWLNPDSTARIFTGKPSQVIPTTVSSREGDTITAESHTVVAEIPYIYRSSMWLLAGLPTLAVTGYLLYLGWMGFVHGVSALRPWTMGQRLLTEARVLMDYLGLMWVPRPFTAGLFNDQIHASQSLWSPVTTLPAVLAVFGLIVGAWILRKKYAALALAVLFYFVGQSMESTTISLELYFEHRNYLPAMLMFWPLALWLCGVRFTTTRLTSPPAVDNSRSPSRCETMFKATVSAVLMCSLAWMTHASATLWGDADEQTILWATLNPHSPRAQASAAQQETASGQPQRAVAQLEPLLHEEPAQVQLVFNLIDAHCALGALEPYDLQQARIAMSTTRDPGTLLTQWFDERIAAALTGSCRLLDLVALESLVDAGLANHRLAAVSGRQQDLLYLKGHIALVRRDPSLALRYFNAALDYDVRPAAALSQAALLGSAGYPREGLEHLKHYEAVRNLRPVSSFGMSWLHAKVLQHQNYWPNEISHLRDTLQKDVHNRDTNGK